MMLSASSGLRYLNKGLWSTNAIYHSLISNTCLCMNKTAECLTFISHNFVSTQQNGCLKRFWLVCYVCMCRLKLVVHRGKELVKELPIHKKSYYTFGRNGAAADVVLDHKSISRCSFLWFWIGQSSKNDFCFVCRVHAALVHHKNGTVVVIDLGSAHGTRVQNKRLARKKPLTIEFGHIIRWNLCLSWRCCKHRFCVVGRFGASSRTYRVMPVLVRETQQIFAICAEFAIACNPCVLLAECFRF